ncbi:MAG: bifunctional folylpolyglutamate synthase/dihydrofolate synthase [Sphingomonadales bacterium]|nr:bifunctional folylpolyglutamate synthase/dihydrofolate synthase [Sphingomonadales bacterium]
MADHATSDDPAVQKQLDRLTMLSPGRDVLGLERISELMVRLGNPHRKLPPVFHVAGTNGKGSTCAFLRASLEAAGHSVHMYTSPHLIRFNERIRVAGRLIDDAMLAPLLAEVLDCSTDIAPSFFEATTAAAFLAFSRTPAEAAIIEVGLGGRLDATNVIGNPLVCGIAQLGIDHQAFLGDDAVTIAGEKAGIAKAGVPLVTMNYPKGETLRIAEVATNAGASCHPKGSDWDSAPYRGQLHYRDEIGKLSVPLPRLPGTHQAMNAALAIAMLRHQSMVAVPEPAIRAAMGWADWPARLQQLGDGSLTRLVPGTPVWIDGCHNPASAEVVASQIDAIIGTDTPLHIIVGVLANKDAEGILTPFLNRATSFRAVPIPDHPHHSADDLANWISAKGADAAPADDVACALRTLAQSDTSSGIILVLGSLYLAGDVLRENGEMIE